MTEEILRNKQGLTEEEFLASYDLSRYQRPSVTVDMLIFTVTDKEPSSYRKLPEKVLRLLLIKRGDHPFMGQWALPGGFVRMDEDVEEAARRELREETSIEDIYMEQLYTWGEVERDPRTRVISCSYMSLVDSTSLNVKANDDAEDAKWFTVSSKLIKEQKDITEEGYILQRYVRVGLTNEEIGELSAIIKWVSRTKGKTSHIHWEVVESTGIAFDHGKIIEYGIERLRSKIEYTDIAFSLMPERFTLTELQKVYEVILDKELLKANFRRKISSMVLETDEYTRDAGHRPSKLYKFNPKGTYEDY